MGYKHEFDDDLRLKYIEETIGQMLAEIRKLAMRVEEMEKKQNENVEHRV